MISVYVDGSYSSGTKRGGIGVYGEFETSSIHLSAPLPLRRDTTSQIGELWSAIIGLELVELFYPPEKSTKNVKIYSDSAYIVNCFKHKWYERWGMRNSNNKKWQNKQRKSIANLSFWIHLFSLSDQTRGSKFWDSVEEDFVWIDSIKRPIFKLPPTHKVEIIKVAAHSGNRGNTLADRYAVKGRDLPYPLIAKGGGGMKEWKRPESSRQVSIAGRGRADQYHSIIDLYSGRI